MAEVEPIEVEEDKADEDDEAHETSYLTNYEHGMEDLSFIGRDGPVRVIRLENEGGVRYEVPPLTDPIWSEWRKQAKKRSVGASAVHHLVGIQ